MGHPIWYASEQTVALAGATLEGWMMDLKWMLHRHKHPIALAEADFGLIAWQGVYLVWLQAASPTAVSVGNGAIAAKVRTLQDGRSLERFAGLGPLYVSWALVPAQCQDGVQRHLVETLLPPLHDAFGADTAPIAVNLPWQALSTLSHETGAPRSTARA